jgi:hypothetical protein
MGGNATDQKETAEARGVWIERGVENLFLVFIPVFFQTRLRPNTRVLILITILKTLLHGDALIAIPKLRLPSTSINIPSLY